jgi:hypothetical protein
MQARIGLRAHKMSQTLKGVGEAFQAEDEELVHGLSFRLTQAFKTRAALPPPCINGISKPLKHAFPYSL